MLHVELETANAGKQLTGHFFAIDSQINRTLAIETVVRPDDERVVLVCRV